MGSGVDEVGERGQGGRKTDDGTIERGDQDLGVGVEGMGYLEVVGHEAAEEVEAGWSSGCGGSCGILVDVSAPGEEAIVSRFKESEEASRMENIEGVKDREKRSEV